MAVLYQEALEKQIFKEGNIKSLTASKGDFKGRNFPLTILIKIKRRNEV